MSENLITRKELKFKLGIKSDTTIMLYESKGMPVIKKLGSIRYDYDKVVEWMNKDCEEI